ncbi:polymeric immunoglobulin receptor [Carassius gibelio]|uniref:polymeric immunoglobulin receptor n=1 Tax=Carassius gibelio TaxID=101364 RepID=UPI0022799309|nr:polymeric immunoglobulin receptor [Carassius gibelio]
MRAAVITIIITLCLISGQVLCFSVFGCTGGSVMFNCTYKSNDQHKGKYFCRDRDCRTGISTETQRSWVYKGRFSLYDDEDSRFFTVFIRNLSREDDGEYTCGNNQTWSHDVKLVVNKTSSSCGTSVLQTAYKGQTITFHCEYNHMFQTQTKLLYRVNRDPVLVLNSSQSSQSSEKKFNLSDSHKDHFNVTIRDISAADDGVYLCGVEIYGSSQTITHITFIKEIHLNVSGQLTSVQVQAYISKSVFITCKFPEEFKGNKKFIQKHSSQKISVDGQNQWVLHDKVHMYDDISEGVLKVFISDLTEADEGTYRCGVNITDDHLFTEITLNISQVDDFNASSKSALIGESVNLTCNYPEKHPTIKHICKENKEKICENISSSEENRFEFSESTGVYTVSISNVSLRDAGVYWCGEETRDTHLTSVSLTNKHQLTLSNKTELILSSKPPLTSSKPPVVKREGDSVQIKCSYDEKYSAEVKHLCKGKCLTPDDLKNNQSDEDHDKNTKISVKNDAELSLFTVNMTDLRAEDAGKYWCLVKDTFNLSIELMIVMKKVVTREASVGGSVSISCKYFRNQTLRFFCRGDQPNICFIDGVRVSSNNRINSRFSLTEETSAGVFTVNISDLRAEDSGKYWCAEESSGSFIFTEVQLHVTTGKKRLSFVANTEHSFFCQKHEVSQ